MSNRESDGAEHTARVPHELIFAAGFAIVLYELTNPVMTGATLMIYSMISWWLATKTPQTEVAEPNGQ